MVSTRRAGEIVTWLLVLVPLVLWLAVSADVPAAGRGRSLPALVLLGRLAGLTGMAGLSVSFLLSARLRWLEPYFGGLDGLYRAHHRLGLTAFVMLIIHPAALALRFVPFDPARTLGFLMPGHARWAVNVGVYAFWGMVLLLVLTLISRVPYDKWKLSHKALGLVLLAGAVHMWYVESTRGLTVAVAEHTALRLYMSGLVGLGLLGAAYKTLVLPLWPKPRYLVIDVERLNDEVVEVSLAPAGKPLEFVPGQFVFVTFHGPGLTRESHPYTLCGPADAEVLTITVKALGDYTSQLYDRLDVGVEAALEGPYGRFDYRNGGRRQIWIAGGVGVAPFLSWARNMANDGDSRREVDFYYCVHDRTDAIYQDDFEALSEELLNVRVALICSVEEGHLHASDLGDLSDTDIFMCGPKRLTADLHRQLRRRGVPDARIHFEDFEFR